MGTAMVRVRLLGVPTAFDAEGAEVRFRSKKQLGVLVYLVVDGRDRPVSRDVLMEAFWPDVGRDRAYHSLCQAVTNLRAVFGSDAVHRRGDGLQLMVPVQTDIETLATEHERGDLTHPLRELEWWGGVELEHWVEGSRTRQGQPRRAGLPVNPSSHNPYTASKASTPAVCQPVGRIPVRTGNW